MPRIQPVKLENAGDEQKKLLEGVKAKLGKVPNLMSTMVHSPAVLQSYLTFSGAMATSKISPALREQIALAVGELNNCDYCLAAHSAIGKRAGLSDDAVIDARRGKADDQQAAAALTFARKVVSERGHVSDADIEAVRAVGFGDAEIAEIVAAVALNIFTNYFNHVTDPEVDFPRVPQLAGA